MILKVQFFLSSVITKIRAVHVHKFWLFIVSLIWLYLLLLLIVIIMYKTALWIGLLKFNIVIMLLLLIGVIIDTRFSKKSVIILIILIIVGLVQVILYKYIQIVPILILKDIFWYSIVINVSFIWHMCILQWMNKISTLIDWNYGIYLSTRWSIITSMTGILMCLNWVDYIISRVDDYYWFTEYQEIIVTLPKLNIDKATGGIDIIKQNDPKTRKEWYRMLNAEKFHWDWPVDVIVTIVRSIVMYFLKSFQTYSLILMGKMNTDIFKQPWEVYVYFLVLCIISIIFLIPRLYIVWVIKAVLEVVRICSDMVKERINCKLTELWIWDYIFIRWDIIKFKVIPGVLDWGTCTPTDYILIEKSIIVKDFIFEYEQILEFYSVYSNDQLDNKIAMFDICDIFIYRSNMRIIIIANMLSKSYREVGYVPYIKEDLEYYKIDHIITVEDMGEIMFREDPHKGRYGVTYKFINCFDEDGKIISIWKFLFGCENDDYFLTGYKEPETKFE